ncbi:hypothetical protein F2P81_008526 [Scophthalmus maximus]|uniref:Anaphase-promoting complex subunit 4-like WD40 domain-containing protein n=1 Tax=Scophthalmus maximus TaxID=52904 RepID=A0A6A4TBI8_SCOMX|nr:hypothetical protein F2P81_008526 [Scophthalmus maximus]
MAAERNNNNYEQNKKTRETHRAEMKTFQMFHIGGQHNNTHVALSGKQPLTSDAATLDWPVRTLSFSHDGKMLASASEDHFIDIAEVETGEKLWEVQCDSPTFTVAWHPKRPLLAYACDDKDGKYDNNREAGTVKLFGLPNDS